MPIMTTLVPCPLSLTMSRKACRKRREKLERIRGIPRGTEDQPMIPGDVCKECESLFENE